VDTEAILPYLAGVHRDSAWAIHGCPSLYRVEDVHYGVVGPDRLLDHVVNYGCHVVMYYPLQGVY
jgi:hypothetical protein